MNTRILCLGNELVCDDAVGTRIGRLLGRLELPDGVRVDTRPSIGIDLIDVLEPDERLVIVDASKTGRTPGEITIMSWSDVEAAAVKPYCSHGLGIAEAMKMCRVLAPERVPREVLLVGLEGQEFESFGLELTPAVKRAFPQLVERVLRIVEAPQATIDQALSLAASEAEPSLERVCAS